MSQTYRLLALCARAEGHPRFYEELTQQAGNFNEWETLPIQSELHGMAPLLWWHLWQAKISIPAETARTLQGLSLRHRIRNQAHCQVLKEILTLFEKNGIRAQVLKGLALAHQYYPNPALRPISDIDLLLPRESVLAAWRLLEADGFNLPGSNTLKNGIIPKELTANAPARHGVPIHIELHHHDPRHRHFADHSPDDELNHFDESPNFFDMDGSLVHTPSHADTLRYLFLHLHRHLYEANPSKPLALKWIADIISLVEQQAHSLDWKSISRQDLRRLEVFYSLTPLPPALDGVIPVKSRLPPQGIDQYPAGWPLQAFKNRGNQPHWRYIQKTFSAPSDWWLKVYYGIDDSSLPWQRAAYRLQVLQWLFWAIMRKLGNQNNPVRD